jgi:hypothetical protein
MGGKIALSIYLMHSNIGLNAQSFAQIFCKAELLNSKLLNNTGVDFLIHYILASRQKTITMSTAHDFFA